MSQGIERQQFTYIFMQIIEKYIYKNSKELNAMFENMLKNKSNIKPFTQHMIQMITLGR